MRGVGVREREEGDEEREKYYVTKKPTTRLISAPGQSRLTLGPGSEAIIY